MATGAGKAANRTVRGQRGYNSNTTVKLINPGNADQGAAVVRGRPGGGSGSSVASKLVNKGATGQKAGQAAHKPPVVG